MYLLGAAVQAIPARHLNYGIRVQSISRLLFSQTDRTMRDFWILATVHCNNIVQRTLLQIFKRGPLPNESVSVYCMHLLRRVGFLP